MATPMERALEIARDVLGSTSPNPAVGCVIVKDGTIIGEGSTQPPGGPHAEVVALDQAGDQANGADMYVTLEPCSHFGRTPPCTNAIGEAGLDSVHVAVRDPNPSVAGTGIERLLHAGVQVVEGEHRLEATRTNEAFMKWVTTRRPFVYVKFAMSLDGKIATSTGDSKWITGGQARDEVHRLRSVVDAIMVGANTARLDDPRLTARGRAATPNTRQPIRIVVDAKASLAPTANMLKQPGRTIVATTPAAPAASRQALSAAGAEIEVFPTKKSSVDIDALLQLLGDREVTSVVVEGGGSLIASFLDAGFADKVIAFVAPMLLGGSDAPTPVGGKGAEQVATALRLREIETQRFGDDVMISGYIRGN